MPEGGFWGRCGPGPGWRREKALYVREGEGLKRLYHCPRQIMEEHRTKKGEEGNILHGEGQPVLSLLTKGYDRAEKRIRERKRQKGGKAVSSVCLAIRVSKPPTTGGGGGGIP